MFAIVGFISAKSTLVQYFKHLALSNFSTQLQNVHTAISVMRTAWPVPPPAFAPNAWTLPILSSTECALPILTPLKSTLHLTLLSGPSTNLTPLSPEPVSISLSTEALTTSDKEPLWKELSQIYQLINNSPYKLRLLNLAILTWSLVLTSTLIVTVWIRPILKDFICVDQAAQLIPK